MPKQTTGEFMATLRKANGYTQAEVAEKLNISNRTLSSWETDRTLPDVLMLPAIADLYGVTVDELLRGERAANTRSDISETSLKSVYKNRFGTFCSKRALALGLSLMCAFVFTIGCALSLWTNAPSWLDWLMLISGVIGMCACIAVITYQYSVLKTSIGVILDEDLTTEKKAFLTALRHKLETFLLICAAPYALCAAVTLAVLIIANPQNGQILGVTFYVRYGYVFIICLNAAIALILFTAYLAVKRISEKKYYDETQKATARTNGKLIGRLALFGCIPLAVVIVLNIALAIAFPGGQKTLYQCNDFNAFRTHMHTLIVDKSEYPSSDVPEGEYHLSIPSYPEPATEYDLGNGFYGIYYTSTSVYPQTGIETYWGVTYGKHDITNPWMPYWQLYVYELDGKEVVNARYYFDDHTYDIYGNRISGESSISEIDGQYHFMQDITPTLNNVAAVTLAGVPALTIVICAIIFGAKRKKQKYGF